MNHGEHFIVQNSQRDAHIEEVVASVAMETVSKVVSRLFSKPDARENNHRRLHCVES